MELLDKMSKSQMKKQKKSFCRKTASCVRNRKRNRINPVNGVFSGRLRQENAGRQKKPLDIDDSDFQTTSNIFTERQAEEFADKKVRKAADRAEKAGRNLKKAKAEIPVQKKYTMKRIFDEKTGKAKYLLVPVEKEKTFQPESLKKRVLHRVELEGGQVVHGKIAEAEKENTAVEGAHKSEQALESAYHYAKAYGKGKEQRKREQISRLEKKKMKADVELAYQEFLRDNPHLNKEGIHKQL